MSLDAHIVDSETGAIDTEFVVPLSVEQHGLLFAHPDMQPALFPLLTRIKDYYSDADYAYAELEALIAELERAAVLFGPTSSVCRFTGHFHSLCCKAFMGRRSVALIAD